jgi:Major Facilitator Superfamily
MTDIAAQQMNSEAMTMHGHSPGVVFRSIVIGLTAFLTVVDLFATQAILPSLARHYGVTPAAMGFAVDATTMGMAAAGLIIGFLSQRIDRRAGILISLLLLAIPTSLLAIAPDLATFTVLRIAQGLCMASAFTLTLAYLGEQCSAMDAGGAFAASRSAVPTVSRRRHLDWWARFALPTLRFIFECQRADFQAHGCVLAARSRPSLASIASLETKRAQGRPDAGCTRSLVCNKKSTRVIHHRFNRDSRPSLRDGLRLILVLSPVSVTS